MDPSFSNVSQKQNDFRSLLLRILSFIFVIAISIFIYSIRDQAAQYLKYGYLGIFIISFLAYATVILPAPGITLIFAMGAIFPPYLVGLAAGAGAALGELTGYLAGYSGRGVVGKSKHYDRLTYWMSKHGGLTTLVLAGIPNPIFDLAGLAAGALKMPVLKFLFWCWIGETIKMLFFAYAGYHIIENLL